LQKVLIKLLLVHLATLLLKALNYLEPHRIFLLKLPVSQKLQKLLLSFEIVTQLAGAGNFED